MLQGYGGFYDLQQKEFNGKLDIQYEPVTRNCEWDVSANVVDLKVSVNTDPPEIFPPIDVSIVNRGNFHSEKHAINFNAFNVEMYEGERKVVECLLNGPIVIPLDIDASSTLSILESKLHLKISDLNSTPLNPLFRSLTGGTVAGQLNGNLTIQTTASPEKVTAYGDLTWSHAALTLAKFELA